MPGRNLRRLPRGPWLAGISEVSADFRRVDADCPFELLGHRRDGDAFAFWASRRFSPSRRIDMTDRQKVETILSRRFPSTTLADIAAAANAIMGLGDEWRNRLLRRLWVYVRAETGAEIRLFRRVHQESPTLRLIAPARMAPSPQRSLFHGKRFYFPLTLTTGQGAIATTRSATLPRKNVRSPHGRGECVS